MSAPSQSQSDRARLFLALWPPPELQQQLCAMAKDALAWGGKLIPQANLHATVAFLGHLTGEQTRLVEAACGAVEGKPVNLVLDSLGYWPKPQVVWVGCRYPAATLVRWVARLGGELRRSGIQIDERPYVPHITLARKVVRKPVLPVLPPIPWTVTSLHLVESVLSQAEVRYGMRKSWDFYVAPDNAPRKSV